MVVRYADDFVVLHQDSAVIEQARTLVSEWLARLGLELKPAKTQIVHTLDEHQGRPPGFDFLGFTVRQFHVGRTHTGKSTTGQPLGFKTIIRPSKEAQRRHSLSLKRLIREHRMAPQAALVARLNPLIRGWSRYFAIGAAKGTFGSLDYRLYLKLRRWAKRRHSDQSCHWVMAKYWRLETGRWAFGTVAGLRLIGYARTPIERHVKVRSDRSPFDGDWSYWGIRLKQSPTLSQREAGLLRRQRGRCSYCRGYFRPGDLWEIDHVVPTSVGGATHWSNLQLLHRHCHDAKTLADGLASRSSLFTNQTIEEPCEAKASRTVLETGGSGDRLA